MIRSATFALALGGLAVSWASAASDATSWETRDWPVLSGRFRGEVGRPVFAQFLTATTDGDAIAVFWTEAEGHGPATMRVVRSPTRGPGSVVFETPVGGAVSALGADLTGDGRRETVLAWRTSDRGNAVAVIGGVVPPVGPPSFLLSTVADNARIEDVDADGRPDLVMAQGAAQVLSTRLSDPAVARIPVAYGWTGKSLARKRPSPPAFTRREEAQLRRRLATPFDAGASQAGSDRVIAWLDLALWLEVHDRKAEAFEAGREALKVAGVPFVIDRDEASRHAALVPLAREARQGMARVAGLRELTAELIAGPSPTRSSGSHPAPGVLDPSARPPRPIASGR